MILVFGWNIAGAAIATVIGNVVGAGYYIVYFLKGSSSLSISLKDFSVKEKVASGVLAIGIPAALGNLLMSLSSILMNSQMAKYGDMAVAVWALHEGHNDDKHGLYRTWAGRSAAARLLCRCEKLGALQKFP